MNPSLQQVERWMAAQHRMVRWSPVTSLTASERLDAITYIHAAFTNFTKTTGCRLTQAFVATKDDEVDPVKVFEALTKLHAEVIGAAHVYGLAAALSNGVYELTNPACEPGAGPPRHEPDFRAVLEKVYDYDSED